MALDRYDNNLTHGGRTSLIRSPPKRLTMVEDMQAPFLPAILALAAWPLAAQYDDDSLTWFDNYPKALQVARATGKPIFLEYRCEP